MKKMPWLMMIAMILIATSCRQEKGELRVAGMETQTDSFLARISDSLLNDEQFQFSIWMTQTFYALKHEGVTTKKAWLHIDSLTRLTYNGKVPQWYPVLKQESDSLMREKNKYRRKRIV